MRKYSIIILLIIFLTDCKKIEVPDPISGDPVFTLEGLLQGDSIAIIAGDDDYFMFTSTSADQNGVFEFLGHLRPEDCENCGPALKIRFRDVAINNAQMVDVNAAIHPGSYPFYNSTVSEEIQYIANFMAEHSNSADANPVSYEWDFGDGNFSLQANPQHIYENDDDKVVRLEIRDDQNCISKYEKTITFDSNNLVNCGVDFTIEPVQNGTFLQLQAAGTGTAPFSYLWNTGAANASLFYPLQVDSFPFALNFCVTINDSIGCTSSRCKDVYLLNPIGNDIGYCSASFSAETMRDTLSQFDPLQFSTVVIEYTDDRGELYRSDLGEQLPGTHFFEVLSVEDFMDNSDELPTKKLNLHFSCLVYTPDGAMLELKEVQSVFAIAYPN